MRNTTSSLEHNLSAAAELVSGTSSDVNESLNTALIVRGGEMSVPVSAGEDGGASVLTPLMMKESSNSLYRLKAKRRRRRRRGVGGRRTTICFCFHSRLWCCGSFCAVISLLVVFFALLARFVWLPHYVEHAIQDHELEISGVNFTNPTLTSVRLHAHGRVVNLPNFVDLSLESHRLDVMHVLDDGPDATVGFLGIHPRVSVDRDTGTLNLASDLVVTNQTAFANMGHALFATPFVMWSLVGRVTVYAKLWGVTTRFSGIQMEKMFVVTGCDSFPTSVIEGFDAIEDGNQTIVQLHVSADNPSVVTALPLGDVSFSVYARGSTGKLTTLGPPVVLPHMNVVEGVNAYVVRGVLNPSSMDVANQLFTNYLQGNSTPVFATVPMHGGTSLPIYDGVLANLTLAADLPGQQEPIIVSGTAEANSTYIREIIKWLEHHDGLEVPVRLEVQNPLSTSLTIHRWIGDVFYDDPKYGRNPVGYVDVTTFETPNITIPGAGRYLAPAVPIKALVGRKDVTRDMILGFLQAVLVGETFVDIVADLGIRIGISDVYPSVNYTENHIPVLLSAAKKASEGNLLDR